MPLWLGMCFRGSEKLLSHTAVTLFPSYTPSLAQLPLAASSHDPPTALPAFTFSLAFLASEKERPAPSPTRDSSIVHCWQPREYAAKTMASSRRIGLKFSKTSCTREKRPACFFFPSLFLPRWLTVCLRPTKEQAEWQCNKNAVEGHEWKMLYGKLNVPHGNEWGHILLQDWNMNAPQNALACGFGLV